MAAKRLGQFLSNVTGTSGQLLRVKTDESGFEFVTPATIPAYTISNKTVDRALNCTNSNLDELANVVGTLIDDLTAIGAPGSTQQVYQSGTYSNTNSNQGTSYTINHNLGIVPDMIKVYSLDNGQYQEWPSMQIDNGVVYGFKSDGSWTTTSAKVRVYSNSVSGGSPINIIFRVFVIGQVAQVAPFQWSTSEQIYPFERALDGSTLYCKYISAGAMPNSGWASIAHNIPNWSPSKLHRMNIYCYSANDQGSPSHVPLPYNDSNGNASGVMVYGLTIINLFSKTNYYSANGYAAHIYLIYSK